MTQQKIIATCETVPFQGGQDTYHEPALLEPGAYSSVQNFRQMKPGFKQRPGYIKQHSTADGINGVASMYQFSKGKRSEKHFFAQMTDGDVLEATTAPPGVTTGAFGSSVFSGTTIYESDFSAGVDGWVDARGTATGNIDSVGSENDWLRFYSSDVSGNHHIYKTLTVTPGKKYRISFKYYIPAAGAGISYYLSGIMAYFGANGPSVETVDTTGEYSFEGIADSTGKLYIYARKSGLLIFSGKNDYRFDVFFIKELVCAEIIPASWSSLNDLMIYSNGVDQHQIYAGTTDDVTSFYVYDSDTAIAEIPDTGNNYTSKVTDSSSSTVVPLDSLGSFAFPETDYYVSTVAGTASGTTLTGTSTSFLSYLRPGQPINIHASSTLTISDVPHDASTVTIGTKTYTFKTTLTPTEGEVLIGGSAANAASYLVHAINHTGVPDAYYKCAAVHPTVTGVYVAGGTAYVYANTAGTGGNSLASTAVGDHLSWGATALAGGIEGNIIDTVTSDTAATVKTAWSASFSGGYYKTGNDCVLICTPVMANSLYWTVSAPNSNNSTASLAYRSTTGWKTLTITDNTSSGSKTLAASGTMTWTTPTDAAPHYMYGVNGFWLKLSFTEALDSEVEISNLTYGSGFNSIQNVWDGALVDVIEAIFYDASGATSTRTNTLPITGSIATTGGIVFPTVNKTTEANKNKYFIYGSQSIDVGAMAQTGDYLYFSTPDPIIAAYIDVGATPNTTAATTMDAFEYLAQSGSWTSVGIFTDGTNGLSKSGYVTFQRQSDISPVTYNGATYSAYWYRFGLGGADASADVNIGIQVIPYYDIEDFGKGLCNAVWEHRAVYVFDKNPNYIVLSAPDNPQVLSGQDSAIFPVGNGRANRISCMRNYYDALLIGQEEKGEKGGCITILQKSDEDGAVGETNVISSYYGVMNANCMEVIDSVKGGSRAFFLSRNGIMTTDGKTVEFAPNFDKVKNYFDTNDTTDCIRTGYESKMYLKYDSSYHCLKIGLTTGSTATENNIFLVYDLDTLTFSSDTYANNLSCECEADAGSGNVPVVHLAGGQTDGTIYVLNSGLNDVSTAVDASCTLELNDNGKVLRNSELIVRAKAQSAGDMTVTPYYNGVIQSGLVRTLSLTALNTSDVVRRHRLQLNFKNQNVSVKFRHNTVSESFYLLDYGVGIEEYINQ